MLNKRTVLSHGSRQHIPNNDHTHASSRQWNKYDHSQRMAIGLDEELAFAQPNN
jgi:hypothetical protein